MRIVHVITDLRTGGAEIMLRRLVERLQADGVDNAVISLGRASRQSEELGRLGVIIQHLNLPPDVRGLAGYSRLKRGMAALCPDVVHTWMYHADLLGGLAARVARLAPVLWSVHHTPHRGERLKPATRALIRVNVVLARFVPAAIACCSHAAEASHAALGYPRKKMVVIPNGFDTDAFRPDPTASASVRQELDLPPEARLVGLIARFHPQKDHLTFVRSAWHLARRMPPVHFVLAGPGIDVGNSTLQAWIGATGAANRFHVLGPRDDMPRLMAACDIVSTSSAYGEALPLVLGEAMSCGVPCVATDVGDSARIVGDTGRVVPPGDAEALAAAWASILDLTRAERLQLGRQARERVVAGYRLATCVQAYLGVYRELSRLNGDPIRG